MWYSDVGLVFCSIIALVLLTSYMIYRYNKLVDRYNTLNEQYEQKCKELDNLILKFDIQLASWVKEAKTIVDADKLKQEIDRLKY